MMTKVLNLDEMAMVTGGSVVNDIGFSVNDTPEEPKDSAEHAKTTGVFGNV